MARDTRYHLEPSKAGDTTGLTPREISKIEFARKLSKEITKRGWNQSDLAREAGLGRDAISSYIRGRSIPEPVNLSKLAVALEMEPADLLPHMAENAIEHDVPAFEVRSAAGHPDQMWLRVNQRVTAHVALEIMKMLSEDNERLSND